MATYERAGQNQFPFASATVVQVGIPSIEVFTVEPGSDVPEITGGLLLLVEPFDGLEMTGGAGREFVLTVKVTGPDAGLDVPWYRAMAVTEWAPSGSAPETGQDQLPPATVAVQTTCPSIETTIREPSWDPVPLIVGRLLLVVDPSPGEVITGGAIEGTKPPPEAMVTAPT
jgi:hypothetical protein